MPNMYIVHLTENSLCNVEYFTVRHCQWSDLFIIFQSMLKLKYLNFECMSSCIDEISVEQLSTWPLQLTYLKINSDCHLCKIYEWLLIKCGEYLKYFILRYKCDCHSCINGSKWKYIIENYMSQLDEFRLYIDIDGELRFIEEMIESFQTEFWLKHQWYFNCRYLKDCNSILNFYSIPLDDKEWNLEIRQVREVGEEIISTNYDLFKYEPHSIEMSAFTSDPSTILYCYLDDKNGFDYRIPLGYYSSILSYPKNVMTLTNLTHLSFSGDENGRLLIDIFKNAPNLSSLCNASCFIDKYIELHPYLNPKIKKFRCYGTRFDGLDDEEMERFFKIFSNLEYFTFTLFDLNKSYYVISKLLNNMTKLTCLNVLNEDESWKYQDTTEDKLNQLRYDIDMLLTSQYKTFHFSWNYSHFWRIYLWIDDIT